MKYISSTYQTLQRIIYLTVSEKQIYFFSNKDVFVYATSDRYLINTLSHIFKVAILAIYNSTRITWMEKCFAKPRDALRRSSSVSSKLRSLIFAARVKSHDSADRQRYPLPLPLHAHRGSGVPDCTTVVRRVPLTPARSNLPARLQP